MSLVYDQAPDIVYDPNRPRVTTDGKQSLIDYSQPHRARSPAAPGGFGAVTTRRLLEMEPPPKHPWLTVEVAEREFAIDEYQKDRERVFMDSI